MDPKSYAARQQMLNLTVSMIRKHCQAEHRALCTTGIDAEALQEVNLHCLLRRLTGEEVKRFAGSSTSASPTSVSTENGTGQVPQVPLYAFHNINNEGPCCCP